MARNWDSTSNIFLKISFLSDKSGTHVLMVFVLYNIVASLHMITIFFIPPFVGVWREWVLGDQIMAPNECESACAANMDF